MSDEPKLPDPGRRALVIWFDDSDSTVVLESEMFSVLEVPELLRVALDLAEQDLPIASYAEEESE